MTASYFSIFSSTNWVCEVLETLTLNQIEICDIFSYPISDQPQNLILFLDLTLISIPYFRAALSGLHTAN